LLLQQVAQRLKACVRTEDTVARLGGDEFVIMLKNLATNSEEAASLARRVGEKILRRLNMPYLLDAHKYHSTPSIGATLIGQDMQPTVDLLKQADIAMYQVKSQGRNSLCFLIRRCRSPSTSACNWSTTCRWPSPATSLNCTTSHSSAWTGKLWAWRA
jgi:diguanylate cyclase (GGDEF)-like protein